MASMLETFAILFDIDGDQAVSDLGKIEKATDKTEKKLTEAEKASNKFKSSLLGTFAAVAGGITAMFSIGAAISGFTSAIDYADRIGETAEAIGVSTENLSAWSDAAAISGGSAEGLQSSVRSLSKDLYQFAETGKSRAEPFLKSFGIAMKDVNGKARDVFDVLPDIAQAMEGMSKQEAIGFGQKLGLDSGTIMLLQQGKAGLDQVIARQKELGTVSNEDAETAAKFKDSLEDMGKALRPIFLGIANFILPAITWLIEKLQKATSFIKDHKVFFIAAITGIATAITMFYLPAMIQAGIATLAATWPILLIIAAIAAFSIVLGLIIEDIYAFLTGNESLIGELSKKWPIIGKIIEGIRDWFIFLFETADQVMRFFTTLWNNPKKAFKDFGDYLKSVWDGFIDSIPGLSKVLDTVVALFKAAIAPIVKTIEAVTNTIDTLSQKPIMSSKGTWTTLKDIATGTNTDAADIGDELIAPTPQVAAQKLKQSQDQTANMQRLASNNIINSSNDRSNVANTTNNNNVTINTGADPNEVKKVIRDELGAQTKTAIQQLDDGVSH